MGGKKITLETGCPEAAQAQGWRYGVNVSGHSCAHNSSTEGPQALWPLIHRGGSLWNALRTSCDNPAWSLLFCYHVEDGRESCSWALEEEFILICYRNSTCTTSLSCMHWTELKQTPEVKVSSAKSQQENKDFFSSPTLLLAAFPHGCGQDEENPDPIQNRLQGRTQLLFALQALLAVLRAGFNFTTSPPARGANPTARQGRRVESQQQGCLHKLFYLQTWKLIPGDTRCFSALDLFPGLAR